MISSQPPKTQKPNKKGRKCQFYQQSNFKHFNYLIVFWRIYYWKDNELEEPESVNWSKGVSVAHDEKNVTVLLCVEEMRPKNFD